MSLSNILIITKKKLIFKRIIRMDDKNTTITLSFTVKYQ